MSTEEVNPKEDVMDVVYQLSAEQLDDVLGFAKMLHVSRALDLEAEDTPSADEWESTPPAVRQLLTLLIDLQSISSETSVSLFNC
jgi:hypothetical protein